MKQLAGRDFEDLLQVCGPNGIKHCMLIPLSASSRVSKDYFPSRTIPR